MPKIEDAIGQSVVGITYGKLKATGVVIAPGKVVTCLHAVDQDRVKGDPDITVTYEGKAYPANWVLKRTGHDLCLLDVPGLSAPAIIRAKTLPQKGDAVVAIGMSQGKAEVGKGNVVFCDGKDEKAIFLTSAPIKPGYSGGPLCNVNSELIGINAFEGGGAIPLHWLESKDWTRFTPAVDAYYHTLKLARKSNPGNVSLRLMAKVALKCGDIEGAKSWKQAMAARPFHDKDLSLRAARQCAYDYLYKTIRLTNPSPDGSKLKPRNLKDTLEEELSLAMSLEDYSEIIHAKGVPEDNQRHTQWKRLKQIWDAMIMLADPEIPELDTKTVRDSIMPALKMAPEFIAQKLLPEAGENEIAARKNLVRADEITRKIRAGLYKGLDPSAAEYTREDRRDTEKVLQYVNKHSIVMGLALNNFLMAVNNTLSAMNGRAPGR